MKDEKIRLPVHRPDTRCEVGCGKPPKSTRFKPGQSGNPRGRPKGAKNRLPRLNEERLKDIILVEAYRDITVRDGARAVTLPMAMDYKIEWDRELARPDRLGITDLPPPPPHPDQIRLDMNTGQAWIAGPMTKEDKALIDRWKARKPEIREAVRELKATLETEADPTERANFEKHIRLGEKMLAEITEAIPE